MPAATFARAACAMTIAVPVFTAVVPFQHTQPTAANRSRAGLVADPEAAVVARIDAIGRIADPLVPIHFVAAGAAHRRIMKMIDRPLRHAAVAARLATRAATHLATSRATRAAASGARSARHRSRKWPIAG